MSLNLSRRIISPQMLRQPGLFGLSARRQLPSAVINQQRLAATSSRQNPGTNSTILSQQRLNRPIAPHLGIYRPQITSVLSILTRITGLTLSGSFYLFGLTYLIWHPSIDTLTTAFASWPIVLQVLAKFVAAMPFTFHCFNGVRHLVWDAAYMMTNKQVARTGWAVVGLTVGSALGLATLC